MAFCDAIDLLRSRKTFVRFGLREMRAGFGRSRRRRTEAGSGREEDAAGGGDKNRQKIFLENQNDSPFVEVSYFQHDEATAHSAFREVIL